MPQLGQRAGLDGRPARMMLTRSHSLSTSARMWLETAPCAPVAEVVDALLEDRLHQRVQPGGGLVEDEELGVAGERRDEGDLLAVALGVGPALLGRVELEALQQVARRRCRVLLAAGRGGRSPHPRSGWATGSPRRGRRRAAGAGRPRRAHGSLPNRRTLPRPCEHPEQHPDGGGLARAVGSEEAVDLALRHVEVEAVQGVQVSERLDQTGDLDGVRHERQTRRGAGRRGGTKDPSGAAQDLAPQALVTSTQSDCASAIAWSSTARRGRAPAATARRPASRTTGRRSAPRPPPSGPRRHEHARAQDPRRVVGCGLVGLGGLVVATSREALLALAAGLGPTLHVTLAILCSTIRAPSSRATANPPLRTSSTPTGQAARMPRAGLRRRARRRTPRRRADGPRTTIRRRRRRAAHRPRRRTTSPRGGPRSCRPSARGGREGPGRRARLRGSRAGRTRRWG